MLNTSAGDIKFTPSQLKAASHRTGTMVVLASAGSGKTASLTRRCVELLVDPVHRCQVDQLLVVTFTNEAAGEMRSRIHRDMRGHSERIADPYARQYARRQAALMDSSSIMTLHAFCNGFLKNNFAACDVNPSMRLMDETEADLLLHDAAIETLRGYAAAPNHPHQMFFDYYKYSCGARSDLLMRVLNPLFAQLDNSPDPDQFVAQLLAGLADHQTGIGAIAALLHDKLMAYVDLLGHAAERLRRYGFARTMVQNLELLCAQAQSIDMELLRPGVTISQIAERSIVPRLDTIRRPSNIDVEEFNYVKESEYKVIADGSKKFFKEGLPDILKSHNSARRELESQYLRQVVEFVCDVRRRLGDIKIARNLLDFSDLEHRTLGALRDTSNGLLAEVCSHYRHILVDEYQDINPVQEELISLLSGGLTRESPSDRSRFMVGDVLQSIYGFRGAAPDLLFRHYRRMQALIPENAVEMRENFRTAAHLLIRINALLEPILNVVDEMVQPVRMPPASNGSSHLSDGLSPDAAVKDTGHPGDLAGPHSDTVPLSQVPLPLPARQSPPLTYAANDSYQLSLTIVECNRRQMATGAATPDVEAIDSDIDSNSDSDPESGSGADSDLSNAASQSASSDVSVSSTRAEAMSVADSIRKLLQAGRLTMPDGKTRPVEYSDIVILMRSLRTVAPVYVRELALAGIPVKAQVASGFLDSQCVLETISLLRVLDNPEQDIDVASTLVGMYGCLQIHELAHLRLAAANRRASLHQILTEIATGSLSPDSVHLTAHLCDRIKRHKQRLDNWRQTVSNQGVADGLAQIFEQSSIRPLLNGRPDGALQLANLELLLSRALRYAEDGSQGVKRFLEFIELLSDRNEDISAASVESVDCVRIMSIHASKGLEFPVVILVGLGRNINQRSSNTDLLCNRSGDAALRWVNAAESERVESSRYWAVAEQMRRITLQEEARLLYVAMTRARDHLLLFGTATAKAITHYRSRVADTPQAAARRYGIVKTLRMLDLIAPVMMNPASHVSFDVAIVPAPTWTQSSLTTAAALQPPASDIPIVPDDAQSAAQLERIWHRMGFQYPHATQIPAVVSVSRLKKDQLSAGHSPLIPAINSTTADIEGSIRRGLAVHTFMQRVDFSVFATAKVSGQSQAAIGRLIDDLICRGHLPASAREIIEIGPLDWFIRTDLFDRIAHAAAQDAIRREMPLMWTLPASHVAEKLGSSTSTRSATDGPPEVAIAPSTDTVMVRGIIDLLLCNTSCPTIIDYKTDQPQHIQQRLPAYQEQINLYAAAVRRLLNVKAVEGYLVFFAGRQITRVL